VGDAADGAAPFGNKRREGTSDPTGFDDVTAFATDLRINEMLIRNDLDRSLTVGWNAGNA
jgi:hypothetical protein